ncbi:MAG: ATP-binding protein, partial [Thermoanaerobaculia bacterium]
MGDLSQSPPAPAASAPQDVCPECGGRGWKVEPDGGAGMAVRCDCAKRELGAFYLAHAGIPERYLRCRLENFKPSVSADAKIRQQLARAHKQCQLYVDSFLDLEENRFRESGLILIGPPGIGKTHLAVAVLIELIERYNLRGRFVDFTSLLHQIQSTFDSGSPESKHHVLDPVIKAEVLVLDELGSQKPTDWVKDTLYLIMNTRYTERRPTLFTSNYRLEAGGAGADDPNALASRLSPLLVSRLYEMAQPVRL